MKHRNALLTIAAALLIQACSGGNDQPAAEAEAPADAAEAAVARVYIAGPANGATVTSPVTIEFGIDGYNLAPAGTYENGTGHHHLLVDTELPPLDAPIPADDNHLHYGKGQTSGVLELEPGDHTLQLLLGDGNHVPHSTALISDPIVITVVVEDTVE
jgi:hypothetical protein